MLILGLHPGATECGPHCPFYERSGVVAAHGGPLRTFCRMLMQPWSADCNLYDACRLEHMEVTDDEWQQMQQRVGKTASHQRKLYTPYRQPVDPYTVDYDRLHPNEVRQLRRKRLNNKPKND